MLEYPNINPIAFILPILDRPIYWYGIMYLIGFAFLWFMASRKAKQTNSGWSTEEVGDMIFYGMIGVIIGGRLGSGLFYHTQQFFDNPFYWMIAPILGEHGGMAFHGGLLGVLIAFWYFARKTNRRYFQVTDFFVPFIPFGLAAGRLGNFINGELWGRVASSDFPLGMVFPTGGDDPRHPSQLYQLATEGLLLLVILLIYQRMKPPEKALSGTFLAGYGIFRFFIEFFREPDAHIQAGHLGVEWLTRGQMLCVPMVLAGMVLIYFAYKKPVKN